MTTIAPDALLQVEDVFGTVHAAAVGPGVFCQGATEQEYAPAVLTVSWDHGTDRVNCMVCIGRLAPSTATEQQQVAYYATGAVA